MSNEQRGAGLAELPVATEGPGRGRAGASGPEGVAAGEPAGAGPQQQGQGPARGVVREYFESLVVTAIMALFGMTFVVQAVKVPTGSMQNTILIGDHLLVNKFIFAPGPVLPFLPQREIRRGDIIVFKYPGLYQSPQFRPYGESKNGEPKIVDDNAPNNLPFKTNYVKRVVGLPGERVELRGAEVFVNGQPLEEQRVPARNPPDDPDTGQNESEGPLTDESGVPLVGEHAPMRSGAGRYTAYVRRERPAAGRAFPIEEDEDDGPAPDGEKTFDIPAGHYLVLGDNRGNSQDSRYWGFVPRHLIIGRAMFVYWSFDESLPRGEGTFSFLSDFITNTRWRRTGTLVR